MLTNKKLNLVIFIIPITFLVIFLFSHKPVESGQVLSGFIQLAQTDASDYYRKTLINSYEPDISWHATEPYGTANQPEIAGVSGLLVELDSGKILFEKDSGERRKIASLTKVMTAVLALEHKDPTAKVRISEKAAEIGENSMEIDAGEIYTLEELLYGLILHSGNDAAYAIAEASAGSSERFVEWMNTKAGELGMKDTFFADPSGLDDSTYSTPEDLVRLTRYALKNPKFREIVRTVEFEVIGDSHKYMFLQNQTNLLSTYPGVAGVKTGFTEEAGLCLITYAENGGHEVVGVVLNSIDRKGDMIMMLDHGFSTLGVVVEHNLLD